MRVRTKISFFMAFCLGLLACLVFVPPLQIKDGVNSTWNFLILVSAVAFQWFGSYLNEMKHRLVWALQRQVVAFEQTDALLRLVFPAVVLVCDDGQI